MDSGTQLRPSFLALAAASGASVLAIAYMIGNLRENILQLKVLVRQLQSSTEEENHHTDIVESTSSRSTNNTSPNVDIHETKKTSLEQFPVVKRDVIGYGDSPPDACWPNGRSTPPPPPTNLLF